MRFVPWLAPPPGDCLKSVKPILFLTGLFTAAVLQAVAPAPDLTANPEATARPRDPKLPTVFIAGDSTAAKNNGDPIQGWGEPFHDYFVSETWQ